jgi:microcystin-dependent protein
MDRKTLAGITFSTFSRTNRKGAFGKVWELRGVIMAFIQGDVIKIDETIDAIWPVGSIYLSVNNINPGTRLPGTTWELWGSGKVPVGVNTSDSSFNTPEKTGGSKTHTLQENEMPSHKHSLSGASAEISGTTGTESQAHNHMYWGDATPGTSYVWRYSSLGVSNAAGFLTGGENQTHTHDFEGTVDLSGDTGNKGSGLAHNNLQPYITCYMWKRIA